MKKQAWEIERELRDAAIPVDRRVHDSEWYESDFEVPYGDALIDMFWSSKVPGSRAPEIPYLEMVQAKANQGYDLSKTDALLQKGMDLHMSGSKEDLRTVTAEIMACIFEAPKIKDHSYHQFHYPSDWQETIAEMAAGIDKTAHSTWEEDFSEKIYQGWIGQLAGGSFGTAIEGYTGKQIEKVYGKIENYITQPETTNDDVVYELVLLDVYEQMGRSITSRALGLEWVRQIPFGWSAEWMAIRNLSMGIMPPYSGDWHNPYSDWIGAQMRGMVCGMLAPASPLEAARLAYIDGVVSHSRNGVYGEMYGAVMTALAFSSSDTRSLLQDSFAYLPQRSEYAAIVKESLEIVSSEKEEAKAWQQLEKRFERYNWIHAYPNIAADIFALWYGEGDFTRTLSLLAQAGNDVDCNGGLVGNILGVMHNEVPAKWSEPIADLLETYIKGKERLSIRELAETNARLAKETWPPQAQ